MRTFDAAIITHPDKDHYNGFKKMFGDQRVQFRRVYHNGIMEQKGKPFGPEAKSGNVKYITELMETKGDLETFLADPSRYGKKLYANLLKDALSSVTTEPNNIRMVAASVDLQEPTYLEGFEADKSVRMRVLGPIIEPDPDGNSRLRWFRTRPVGGSLDAGKTKNGHSVILMLEYDNMGHLLYGTSGQWSSGLR